MCISTVSGACAYLAINGIVIKFFLVCIHIPQGLALAARVRSRPAESQPPRDIATWPHIMMIVMRVIARKNEAFHAATPNMARVIIYHIPVSYPGQISHMVSYRCFPPPLGGPMSREPCQVDEFYVSETPCKIPILGERSRTHSTVRTSTCKRRTLGANWDVKGVQYRSSSGRPQYSGDLDVLSVESRIDKLGHKSTPGEISNCRMS